MSLQGVLPALLLLVGGGGGDGCALEACSVGQTDRQTVLLPHKVLCGVSCVQGKALSYCEVQANLIDVAAACASNPNCKVRTKTGWWCGSDEQAHMHFSCCSSLAACCATRNVDLLPPRRFAPLRCFCCSGLHDHRHLRWVPEGCRWTHRLQGGGSHLHQGLIGHSQEALERPTVRLDESCRWSLVAGQGVSGLCVLLWFWRAE